MGLLHPSTPRKIQHIPLIIKNNKKQDTCNGHAKKTRLNKISIDGADGRG